MSVSSEDMADSVLPLMFQNADKDIFTRLNMGVIYLDEHGSVFSSNEVVKHMTGFTAEELMVKGSDDFDLSTNNEINQLCEFICSTKNLYEQENNRTFKVTDIKGNLKYLSCDLFPLHDNCTNYSGKLCILKDDTIRTVCANEHSFDKDDLKASHLPFVSFLWKCDDGWSVEYVSDNIVQFGYSPDEFISGMLSYADIVHPDYLDFVKEEVEKCQGSHFSKEYLIMTADGDERWILERSYAVRDSNNSITHFHGAILDISARKESERELESMNRYAKALSGLGKSPFYAMILMN